MSALLDALSVAQPDAAPTVGAATAAVHWRWFRAPLEAGEFWLAVPLLPQEVRPFAVGAACALARCEPLLGALEQWLGVPLDVAPVEAEPASAAQAAALTGSVEFSIIGGVAAPVGTRVRLPHAMARRQPLSAALQQGALRWTALHLDVELDAFELPLAQRESLGAGAVLLLPASFRTNWAVRLSNAPLGLALQAQLQPPQPTLRFTGQAAPSAASAPSMRGGLRVRLQAAAQALPPELWGARPGLQGHPQASAWLETGEAQAPAAWRVRVDDLDAQPPRHWDGTLIPALQGWGVRIDADPACAADAPAVLSDALALPAHNPPPT